MKKQTHSIDNLASEFHSYTPRYPSPIQYGIKTRSIVEKVPFYPCK